MPESPANPIEDAANAQIVTTQEWREREIERINAEADAQIGQLQEILEKARALPMNGASPMPEPEAKPTPPVKRDPAPPSPRSELKRRAPRKQMAILRLAKNLGEHGIVGSDIESKLGYAPSQRSSVLLALVAAGLLRKEGTRRTSRWFITDKGRARVSDDKESSPADPS